MEKPIMIMLVLVGTAIGCGAATVAPEATSWARPTARSSSRSNSWRCYMSEEFPNISEAASDDDALKAAQSLNDIASHAPSGTVTAFGMEGSAHGSSPDVVCVKD